MKKKEAANEKLMYDIAQENKRLTEPLTRALKEVESLRKQLATYDKVDTNYVYPLYCEYTFYCAKSIENMIVFRTNTLCNNQGLLSLIIQNNSRISNSKRVLYNRVLTRSFQHVFYLIKYLSLFGVLNLSWMSI